MSGRGTEKGAQWGREGGDKGMERNGKEKNGKGATVAFKGAFDTYVFLQIGYGSLRNAGNYLCLYIA